MEEGVETDKLIHQLEVQLKVIHFGMVLVMLLAPRVILSCEVRGRDGGKKQILLLTKGHTVAGGFNGLNGGTYYGGGGGGAGEIGGTDGGLEGGDG